MSDQMIVERAALAKKEKAELQAIVEALGATPSPRARKVDLIDQILQITGTEDGASSGSGGSGTVSAGSQASNGSHAETKTENTQQHPVGPDGEPLADWEVDIANGDASSGTANKNPATNANNRQSDGGSGASNSGGGDSGGGDNKDETDPNNRRNRRRNRGRGRDRDDAGNEPVSNEPIPVAGYLDLRDEGYGFLRVNSNLPSKEDVYVSVKQVRQYGLRKGDHLTGLSRPANRNEKNPGFHQIDTVNGGAPGADKGRPRFDDLTPLFPSERLVLELRDDPGNLTTRVIDLVAPIGKGQRGLIMAPPKTDKTQVIKDIARAVEVNNPEVHLMVLLLDERPEEVTDVNRYLERADVASSTFDRPPEEHCAVAELTIEKAKRMVEAGSDVCLVVDGITRLARAYNLSASQSGRSGSSSNGIDTGAIHPAKRFFGAARNLEEGGSLTILATALVDTGSRIDETVFDELKDTANMELWLDRGLASKRITPAIDLATSSTRHEDLLFEPEQMRASWDLRRGDTGDTGTDPVEALIEKLKNYPTNQAFIDTMETL